MSGFVLREFDLSQVSRGIIGYGACLIAEGQPITLGEQVIVRDNAVIRSTAKYPVEVGNAVLIGPHTALFGCTIEDEVFLATAHGYSTSPLFANGRRSASMQSYT